MTIDEIRKFLREHGLEAVPATTTSGTLADFISWSPENTAPIAFSGGNFPEGITTIACDAFTPDTAKFSAAFTALTTVSLINSNLNTLVLPDTVTELVLDYCNSPTMACAWPAALQRLSIAGALFASLPALPAGLRELNADSSYLATMPDLTGTSLETLIVSNCPNFNEVGALPGTLTTITCTGTALAVAPDLPVACVNVNLGNCNLTAAQVSAVLAKLVANNQLNGSVILDGSDEAPVDDGSTDKDTLLARGWTVSTN